MSLRWAAALLIGAGALAPMAVCPRPAIAAPTLAPHDPRLRVVLYSADEIYRLPGYVGYQIDLEFAPAERFVGLGAGDMAGLTVAAQANHLFIKPRAADVHTDLTVLTTRRTYHFDYATLAHPPGADHADVIYVLRFIYPAAPPAPVSGRPAAAMAPPARSPEALLAEARAVRRRNTDYWYCGGPQLRPLAAWDDGVQTHVRFAAHTELPALFVYNDDGSESLLDFHVEHDEVVIHRVARRFALRRGRLTGCIVNKGFSGGGLALSTGTISPDVQRVLRRSDDAAGRRH
jgi:type IV secretion system protein VirB9